MTRKTKKKIKEINRWYNNEEGVRNAGINDSEYFDLETEEGQQNVIDLDKSMKDPIYFIEKFVKLRVLDDSLGESQQGRVVNIKLRDYQKDINLGTEHLIIIALSIENPQSGILILMNMLLR